MGMSICNLIEHIVFRMRDEAHMFLELYVAWLNQSSEKREYVWVEICNFAAAVIRFY